MRAPLVLAVVAALGTAPASPRTADAAGSRSLARPSSTASIAQALGAERLARLEARATVRRAFVPGELVALPRPGRSLGIESDGRLAAADARVAAALARHGIAEWRPLKSGPRGASASRRAVTLVSRRAGFDARAAARELMATGAFRAVAPNLVLRPTLLPNDPDLPYQYGVFEPGDADVQLAQAWDVTQGDTTMRIGILDTGVDLGHPDMAGQIWTNPGEIAANGLDDDGNGWVDDVHGYDFGNDDPDPNPHAVIDDIGLDIGFHGTFVAGIAAAATNNAQGIAGAAWRCRIVPLKAVDTAGDLTLEAVTAAFEYATAMHLPVLNLSLGSTDTTAKPFFQALVDDAVAADVMCVAASGNDGTGVPSYPAACDSVLAVGATDDANLRASFSNYGPWVDVAAPGATIWSTICRNYVVDEISQIFYIYFFYWDGERPYMYGDGTSFACPMAAGVAALTRARWPSFNALEAIYHVEAKGDPRVYDQPIGRKLNAFRAVSEGLAAAPMPGAGGRLVAMARPNPSAATTQVEFSLPTATRVRVDVFDAGGRRVRSLWDGERPAGLQRLTWDGSDASGSRVPAGVYFARVRAAGVDGIVRLARLD